MTYVEGYNVAKNVALRASEEGIDIYLGSTCTQREVDYCHSMTAHVPCGLLFAITCFIQTRNGV